MSECAQTRTPMAEVYDDVLRGDARELFVGVGRGHVCWGLEAAALAEADSEDDEDSAYGARFTRMPPRAREVDDTIGCVYTSAPLAASPPACSSHRLLTKNGAYNSFNTNVMTGVSKINNCGLGKFVQKMRTPARPEADAEQDGRQILDVHGDASLFSG